MKLARVIGSAVATAKHPGLDARTVLLVRPETFEGEKAESAFLAVDNVSAGPGDRVLVLREGTGVRQLLGGNPPVRSVIVAVVDDVYVERA
jgi:ethanolamine utilization protein EutN